MKRYMLFCFDSYYPSGGFADFQGDFDTIDEAFEHALKLKPDNYQIVDTVSKTIVSHS